MAKAVRQKTDVLKEDEIPEGNVHFSLPKNDIDPVEVKEETKESESVTVTAEVDIVYELQEEPETDEIRFLKGILDIQETGGWGRHLHDLINERIKQLKA